MTGRRGPEDAELWAHVARTVKPLRRRRRAGPASAAPAAGPAAAPLPQKESRRRGRVPATPPPPPPPPASPVPELAPGAAPGVDRRTATRLRRGRLPIDGRIDLHGMTVEQAGTALRRFLLMSRTAGRRCVLVITGKGARGPTGAGGAIRRELPHWLNGPGLRPLIVAFSEAQPKDGGAGAFYVYLRRERGVERGRAG